MNHAYKGDSDKPRRPFFGDSLSVTGYCPPAGRSLLMADTPSNIAAPAGHLDDTPALPFLVAGVGASAGGLEAYIELLEDLPAKPGLALLVASHLTPDQKSH